MTSMPEVVEVEVGGLLSPSGHAAASSVGWSMGAIIDVPSKDSTAGGALGVMDTGSVGQANVVLYNGLSKSLINAAFVDLVTVVWRSQTRLSGNPACSHNVRIKHGKGRPIFS